jgi:hypothetical protein
VRDGPMPKPSFDLARESWHELTDAAGARVNVRQDATQPECDQTGRLERVPETLSDPTADTSEGKVRGGFHPITRVMGSLWC